MTEWIGNVAVTRLTHPVVKPRGSRLVPLVDGCSDHIESGERTEEAM